MKSIRLFLVAALLSTITLGNFLAALHGYRASTARAQDLLDVQLADTAALIGTMATREQGLSRAPSPRLAFQIWDAGGALIQRSANSIADPITEFQEGYREENFSEHRWRVFSHFDAPSARWILVAERIDIRIELADSVVLQSVVPIVISLPVVAAIVWLVVGNGLSLVRKLAVELGTKRADDLTLLKTNNTPLELAPVVDAINALLRRLTESIQRERRFPADAAHELRTPLSALRVHLHNLKKALPRQTDLLRALDDDVGRLGHLIEQILLLYQTTPEHYQARMTTVDLYTLAQATISDLYDRIEARQQTIALAGAHEEITGDEATLGILLQNLILNASKYSPEQASLTVCVEGVGESVTLEVADTGPGIPEAELSRVLDSFYRSGGDRHSSAAEGCGLGLSIVNHIAELHHAKISLRNNSPGPGLTARVVFPAELETGSMTRAV